MRVWAGNVRVGEIRVCAGDDEPGVAAPRKAEETDALRIDLRRVRRGGQHEIDQAFDVGRPLYKHGNIAGAAHVGMGVSRMVERDGDEPGICKRLGCVVMAEVRAAMPMRYYDEWQL